MPEEKDKPAQDTRFIELANDFAITPLKTDATTVINSKISMKVVVSTTNSGIPVVSDFHYGGISIHKDAEFVKVFSGPLMDSFHSVDIYIKTGQ